MKEKGIPNMPQIYLDMMFMGVATLSSYFFICFFILFLLGAEIYSIPAFILFYFLMMLSGNAKTKKIVEITDKISSFAAILGSFIAIFVLINLHLNMYVLLNNKFLAFIERFELLDQWNGVIYFIVINYFLLLCAYFWINFVISFVLKKFTSREHIFLIAFFLPFFVILLLFWITYIFHINGPEEFIFWIFTPSIFLIYINLIIREIKKIYFHKTEDIILEGIDNLGEAAVNELSRDKAPVLQVSKEISNYMTKISIKKAIFIVGLTILIFILIFFFLINYTII